MDIYEGRLGSRLCDIVIGDSSKPLVSCLIYYVKFFLSNIKKWRSVDTGVTFFVDYLKIAGNVNRIEIIHNNAKVHKQKWMIDWYDFFLCGT